MEKTWRITFIGQVQGVCFRWNVGHYFRDFHPDIAGTVRNLANGDVEVVLFGDEDAVIELEQFCRTNIRAARISEVRKELIDNVAGLPKPFQIMA